DDVTFQMHIDSQFDRLGFGFRRLGVGLRFGVSFVLLGIGIVHWGSGVVLFPAPDYPCYLSDPSLPKPIAISGRSYRLKNQAAVAGKEDKNKKTKPKSNESSTAEPAS